MQNTPAPRGALSPGDTPGSTSEQLLLVTKLALPPVRADLVPRPRLTNQLQLGIQRPLTLIAAPAGFGKTTLLSTWLEHASLPAAWISLEHDDDDLTRFSVPCVHSSRARPSWQWDIRPGTPSGIHCSRPLPPIEIVLTVWINDLAALPHQVALVLDDYHLITAQPIHRAVTYLLDHLPPQLHLVMVTRADPPLSLARLRARGHLTEIRAADLRFTAEETAAFLTRALGLELSGSGHRYFGGTHGRLDCGLAAGSPVDARGARTFQAFSRLLPGVTATSSTIWLRRCLPGSLSLSRPSYSRQRSLNDSRDHSVRP